MLRRFTGVLLMALLLLTAAVWLISPAMAENWAYNRTGDPWAAWEAQGLLWFLRVAAPALALVIAFALLRWPRTVTVLRSLKCELRDATHGSTRRTTWMFRATLVAWFGLALVHWVAGARQSLQDWPVYGFRSGAEVLPNMSESNRMVIRYLRKATPQEARILIVSDQKLFFLSYYLLPRQIVHRMHPAAEHAVPQPHQRRQLPAYRLADLAPDDIRAIHPDFILEYFEGPEFVEPDRLMEDARWIAFVRAQTGDPRYIPSCNVLLRPIDEVLLQ